MISDIYKIEGVYLDPYDVERLLIRSQGTDEYPYILDEVKESGLSSHPLLSKFFVES